MVKAYRPGFTKGNKIATMKGLSEQSKALMEDYSKLNATVYKWEGLEEIGLKGKHIEDIIFWNRYIGIGDKNVVIGARASKVNQYGEPMAWFPNPTSTHTLSRNFVREYDATKFPCMKLDVVSIAESIADECVYQASAYVSSGQNTVAMRTPVVVVGMDSKAEIMFIRDAISEGDSFIPGLKNERGQKINPVDILDLKAQNFLDPLTGYAEFMHAKILAKLGIDALGTQKSSGITLEEATLILKQIKGTREFGLELRKEICEMINEHMNTSITVKIRDIYMEDKYALDRQNSMGNSAVVVTDGHKDMEG